MTKKFARGLAVIAAPFLLVGCFDVLDGDSRELRFSGTVRESATGQPIPGAIVDLQRMVFVFAGAVASDTTDANGQYSIAYEARCEENSDLYTAPGDAHILVASLTGYHNQSNVNIGHSIRCVSAIQTVNFNLDRRTTQ